MPPGNYSRHLFCEATDDDAGRRFLTQRVPFRFESRADNLTVRTTISDTWQSLAARYYAPLAPQAGLESAAGLWWVIADYQPDPVVDPTLEIPENSYVVIPSIRTVVEEILGEARRTVAAV